MVALLLMDRLVITYPVITIIISSLGTGKSYTIEGGNDDTTRGIVPRASDEVFNCILQSYCMHTILVVLVGIILTLIRY